MIDKNHKKTLLFRFATVKYDHTGKNLWNPCMHLCNYSINKYHSGLNNKKSTKYHSGNMYQVPLRFATMANTIIWYGGHNFDQTFPPQTTSRAAILILMTRLITLMWLSWIQSEREIKQQNNAYNTCQKRLSWGHNGPSALSYWIANMTMIKNFRRWMSSLGQYQYW